MEFRATLTHEDDHVLVSFEDLPGAISFGHDEADALAHGRDALVTIVEALIKDHRLVPLPKATKGHPVRVPALLAAKILLHNEMLTQKVSKAELKRRLKVHGPQVDRLVDVRHGSKMDQLEAAFNAMGKSLEISVEDVVITRPSARPSRMRHAARPRGHGRPKHAIAAR